jgi:exopolysaccharide production negative regulator
MRTYDVIVSIGLVGWALGFSPAASFDGTPTNELNKASPPQSREISRTPALTGPSLQSLPPSAVVPRPPAAIPQGAAKRVAPTPSEAMRTGTQALREGKPGQAVTSLEYAAEQGVPGAMWKLGRMYADGDGVDQNKLRAFEYFKNLTKAHAYDPPGTPQARFVASAFVALASFYIEGIPDTTVKADPAVAYELLNYAASYFKDPDAQYHLGRLYLSGVGTNKDSKQAVRWFGLAAEKNHRGAQAMLGGTLFKGAPGVQRQAAKGLAWLTIAKEGAAKDGGMGADDAWINETYKSAVAQASQDEQAMAYRFLEDIVSRRPAAATR